MTQKTTSTVMRRLAAQFEAGEMAGETFLIHLRAELDRIERLESTLAKLVEAVVTVRTGLLILTPHIENISDAADERIVRPVDGHP